MDTARNTYYQNRMLKWLLSITLLFSVFSFSGYTGNSPLSHLQSTQTELVISKVQKTGKQTFSFKKAFELFHGNELALSPNINWSNALFASNLRTQVKLSSASKHFYTHVSGNRFLPEKTIPQSTDEDIYPS
jgi:hypothetical protein